MVLQIKPEDLRTLAGEKLARLHRERRRLGKDAAKGRGPVGDEEEEEEEGGDGDLQFRVPPSDRVPLEALHLLSSQIPCRHSGAPDHHRGSTDPVRLADFVEVGTLLRRIGDGCIAVSVTTGRELRRIADEICVLYLTATV